MTPAIVPAGSLDADQRARLVELVDLVQVQPPYSYEPGEVPPARVWFADLLGRATVALVAVRESSPVGYCVGLPLEAYGKLAPLHPRLPLDPGTTVYLAELGVDPSTRRAGVATALLDAFHEAVPPSTSSCLVRTIAANQPAIALYGRHGYAVVPDVTHEWHGRPRVFLQRTEAGSPPLSTGRGPRVP